MGTDGSSFKAAEFAAMCGISKDTLLYYDSIGLLKPRQRDSNGTRHYHWDQINTHQIITFLQKSGCSLKEIRGFLGSDRPADYLPMLQENRRRLLHERKEIDKSIKVLELLSFILSLSEERSTFVEMNDPPAMIITAVNEDESAKDALLRHIKIIRNNDSIDLYPIGMILDKELLLARDDSLVAFYSVCSDVVDGALPGERGIRYREVISSNSSEIYDLLRKRLKELIEDGYDVGKEIKCDMLVGDPFNHMQENAVFEIYIPVIGNRDIEIIEQERFLKNDVK